MFAIERNMGNRPRTFKVASFFPPYLGLSFTTLRHMSHKRLLQKIRASSAQFLSSYKAVRDDGQISRILTYVFRVAFLRRRPAEIDIILDALHNRWRNKIVAYRSAVCVCGSLEIASEFPESVLQTFHNLPCSLYISRENKFLDKSFVQASAGISNPRTRNIRDVKHTRLFPAMGSDA